MTSLMDPEEFPASVFGDLYHQRWRVEETFKRLKHRLNLEHVTGLSQLAVMQDVAAKVLCDMKTLVTLEPAINTTCLPHNESTMPQRSASLSH